MRHIDESTSTYVARLSFAVTNLSASKPPSLHSAQLSPGILAALSGTSASRSRAASVGASSSLPRSERGHSG
eukprot:3085504-Prymnesium_polylepis.1